MRIMAIDYGRKRTGIAVTDPLQIIAQPLTTVDTGKFFDFLKEYLQSEQVDTIVLGYPKHADNTDADIVPEIKVLAEKIKNLFPAVKIEYWDERYTSKRAVQEMIRSGVKKKKRRQKANIDKMAATIILQDFMQYKENNF